MPFIGAGIQTVKGLVEKTLNKKKLKQLKQLEQADLFELISKEKHSSASILLKQTEYQNLILENSCRKDLSNIEKEIINLMKKNINEKKEELENKSASQLDIANILLTIQQLSHETIEEKYKLNEKFKKFSDKQKQNQNDFEDKQKQNQNDFEEKQKQNQNDFEEKQNNINQKNKRFNILLLIYNVILTGLISYLLISG